MGKYMDKFNFVTNLFLLFVIGFGGIVLADTDGIWTLAENVRGGIFGGDEGGPENNYTFISPVSFNNEVVVNLPIGAREVANKAYVDAAIASIEVSASTSPESSGTSFDSGMVYLLIILLQRIMGILVVKKMQICGVLKMLKVQIICVIVGN